MLNNSIVFQKVLNETDSIFVRISSGCMITDLSLFMTILVPIVMILIIQNIFKFYLHNIDILH